MSEYIEAVAKYVENPDQAAVDRIVKYCGIALRSSKDAAFVSASDKTELNRVRDGFAKKKLGLDAATAEAGIKAVCERMKHDRQKHRVTFYYLLAEATNSMGKLT